MNIKQSIITSLMISVIAGCSTTLDEGANFVRKIQPESNTQCKYLGGVTGGGCDGFGPDQQRSNSLHDMRNQVNALGGNAYVVIDQVSGMGSCASIVVDAYQCPTK